MGVGACIQCHSNHEIAPPHDEMIGVGQGATCASCHNEGDNGYQAAKQLRATIDELAGAHKNALDMLARAERAGMEVKFELNDAKDSLTNVRVLIHGVSTGEVEKVAQPGLAVARKSFKAGKDALRELGFRRKGLAVSLFFILFLASLVYLKLREIEGRKPSATKSGD